MFDLGFEGLDVGGGIGLLGGEDAVGERFENLADKTYREPGSGTDGVGRSFGLTAGVRL